MPPKSSNLFVNTSPRQQTPCVDNKNIEQLAREFDIPRHDLKTDYTAYWIEVIERVQETAWWNAPRPRTKTEQPIWDGRAVLLDAIYWFFTFCCG